MNNALISLGSNMSVGRDNLLEAMRMITDKANQSHFSSIYETEPEGSHKHARYCNCVGQIITELNFDEWQNFFKEIEVSMGRDKILRTQGNVPVDIDIVIWNETVLRPKDLSADYMREGLGQLGQL